MLKIKMAEAIRLAMAEELERDPAVIFMGEDIGVYGGAFGVSTGMLEKFGPQRIIETPISEPAVTGVAIGAAMTGMRPILEIMFMDFMTLCMDQLLNHGAKFHHAYAGQVKIPLVIRTPAGGGRGYGPTHSQSLESMLQTIPCIKIVAPSNGSDAKGLLKSSVRDNNIVVFVESKLLYHKKFDVPKDPEHLVPIGKAALLKKGTDLTIVTYSRMVTEAVQAIETLEKEDGTNIELIDLRTVKPIDLDCIMDSVKKTGRLVTIEEGVRTGGVGAEVIAKVCENLPPDKHLVTSRIAAMEIPIPASYVLEQAVLPSADKIVKHIRQIMNNS